MKRAWMGIILLTLATGVYADDPDNVEQGAKEYNWQSCIDAKMGTCMDSCETSEDPNCKDSCNSLASDKCQAEGLQPPSQ